MKQTHWLCVVAFGAVLGACHHDKPAEGPMEKAGKKVDQAASDTKDAAKDASDKAGDKADEAGEKVKEKTKSDD